MFRLELISSQTIVQLEGGGHVPHGSVDIVEVIKKSEIKHKDNIDGMNIIFFIDTH